MSRYHTREIVACPHCEKHHEATAPSLNEVAILLASQRTHCILTAGNRILTTPGNYDLTSALPTHTQLARNAEALFS
jgi:hypothetical protein